MLSTIAKQQKTAGSHCKEGNSLRIAQRISTAIHMANARALLKRMPQMHHCSSPWDFFKVGKKEIGHLSEQIRIAH